MNGKVFADCVTNAFPRMFRKARKGRKRIFLQDGDPSQNSAKAKAAMNSIHCTLLKIPPRSPDLNPIENIFKVVGDTLHRDAITMRLKRETLKEFETRVTNTINSISTVLINKVIESMNTRIRLIKENGGERTKY